MESEYQFKSGFVHIYLNKGIVHVIFGNTKITPDIATIIVKERLKVTGGRSYPTLADYRNGTSVDKESRAIFSSDQAMKNVAAGAILFSNPIHRMFINAYLWFDNPSIPTAVFANERKALEWLELYKLPVN